MGTGIGLGVIVARVGIERSQLAFYSVLKHSPYVLSLISGRILFQSKSIAIKGPAYRIDRGA